MRGVRRAAGGRKGGARRLHHPNEHTPVFFVIKQRAIATKDRLSLIDVPVRGLK